MKAVGYRKSLPIEDADSLIDFETAKPEPKGRDVRVAVRAISANPVDYKVRKRAAPPEGETKILGYDAAGIVDATGPDVTLFKPGDEVFYAGSILRQRRRCDDCRGQQQGERADQIHAKILEFGATHIVARRQREKIIWTQYRQLRRAIGRFDDVWRRPTG